MRRQFTLRFLASSLTCLALWGAPALAAALTQLQAIEAPPGKNQVVFSLSQPNTAKIMTTQSNGKKRIIIDIQNTTLQTLGDKTNTLTTLHEALGHMGEVSLDEFKLNQPMIRFVIKPHNPALTANFIRNGGSILILQLNDVLETSVDLTLTPIQIREVPPTTQVNSTAVPKASASQTVTTQSEPSASKPVAPTTPKPSMIATGKKQTSDSPVANPKLPPKTTAPRAVSSTFISGILPELDLAQDLAQPIAENSPVYFTGKALNAAPSTLSQKQLFENESLRRQLEDLKAQLTQQADAINALQAEKDQLLTMDAKGRSKKRIAELETQLKKMREQSATTQQSIEALGNAPASNNRVTDTAQNTAAPNTGLTLSAPPLNTRATTESAQTRGILFNTLDQLSKNDVETLVNAEKLFRDGRTAELQNRSQDAITRYQQALKLAPQVETYTLALSSVYIKQKQYTLAQTTLQQGLRYQPDSPALLNELGKVAALQHDYTRATQYFKQALPTDVVSNYASALSRSGKLEEAEALYQLAASSNPQDADVQFNLGNLCLTQKRYTDAERYFRQAVTLNPNFAEAHYHLGLIYNETQQTLPAIQAFQSYLQLMPDASNRTQVESVIQSLKNEG